MKIVTKTVIATNELVIARQIQDEHILVPMYASSDKVDSIFNLNRIGADIWKTLSGNTIVDDVIKEMADQYDADKGVIEVEVLEFLNELLEAGLIVVIDDARD